MSAASAQNANETLTCTICNHRFTDPCTLTCQHTFCRTCITKYAKSRPDLLKLKTLPCSSCRHVTKVPDPTAPMEKWAWQIQPSASILEMEHKSKHGQIRKGLVCHVCEQLGEATRAASWCPECDMALCERCSKSHHVIPALRGHQVRDLSAEVNVRRERSTICPEHPANGIEFHCGVCNKSACQTCCNVHHNACKNVVTIESMREEMTSNITRKRNRMSVTLERKTMIITTKTSKMKEAFNNKLAIQSQIQYISQKALDKVKDKEKKLMAKLEEVTKKQMNQLQADVKLEENDVQTYKQRCEFIENALNSGSIMDVYYMHKACESWVLIHGDVRNNDTTHRQVIEQIKFAPGTQMGGRDEVLIGEIEVTYKNERGFDIRTNDDEQNPRTDDVTVLVVDNVRVIVLTDETNKCVKSFYPQNGELQHSRLPLDNFPSGITRLKKNQVIVTVPDSKHFVTAKVTPDLAQVLTIKTSKSYYSIGVLSSSSLVAGTMDFSDLRVDILNMGGKVMKSITHQQKVKLFSLPNFLCVNNKGNLIVSDRGEKSVLCLSQNGDVLWQYKPQGTMSLKEPGGITTTNTGDVLFADKGLNKVIYLNDKGEFIRDVVTSADGLADVNGIICTPWGSLVVCDGSFVSEYTLD